MKRKVWNYKVQKITLKVTGRARHLKWWLQQLLPVLYFSKKKKYREYDCMKVGYIYVERDRDTQLLFSIRARTN